MPATINGSPLYYEVRRNAREGAPAVLLLHGWGCDGDIFSFIRDALAENATVVTLDFPGHGRSPEPPVPWGVGEYTEQVRAMLLAEGLSPVQVVAHSFGGRVALMLAARYPELVEKLVLTGGAGIKKPVSERSRRRSARFKRFTALAEKLKAIPLLRPLAEACQAALRRRYGSADYVKLNEAMRKTFVKVVSEDLTPLLATIQAPTLLVWGGADTETPLWMAQVMEKRIPDAGLVVFEGGSHFAFLEEWRRFVIIVQRFFMEGRAG